MTCCTTPANMAPRTGFEPVTSSVTGWCSNRLNYRSICGKRLYVSAAHMVKSQSISIPYQKRMFCLIHRLSHCRFGHGHMAGQFFRVLPPAHHGINGTEKVQLLPPGVAGPMEALPACTSPLQGSGDGFFFPRTISHRALGFLFTHAHTLNLDDIQENSNTTIRVSSERECA